MRLLHALILAAAAIAFAVGNAAAKDPAAPYLGMTIAEVIACAGEPHSRFESGPGKETLTFRYNGAGPVPADKSAEKKSDDKKNKKSADKKKDTSKPEASTDQPATAGNDKAAAADSGGNDQTDAGKGSDKAAAKPDEKKSGDKKSDDKKSDKNKLASIFGKNKKKENKDWTCSASLVFENGRLVRVNFSHKDVRSPYQWQSEKNEQKAEEMRKEGVPTCEFSLPRCAR